MSAVVLDPTGTPPWIRLLTESRPAAASFAPAPARSVAQPMLPVGLAENGAVPDTSGVRRALVSPPGAVRPDGRLRDPREWAALLAVAVLQALSGERPVNQLERWLDEEVLAAVGFAARSRARARQADQDRTARQASVVSVRVQCPTPAAAEVAAHLRLGRRSVAMALRLEAFGNRWLCTALELGPRT